jgi:hypothetical protein
MKIIGLGMPVLCLLLAACGGDGSDGGGLTTTPPPPPPPPATPLPLKVSASYDAFTGVMNYYQLANSNPVFNQLRIGGRGTATFSYDATSGTYTVQSNGLTASFGQSDQIADTSYNDTFSKSNGSVSDAIKLYGNVRSDTVGAPEVALSYTSFGVWTHSDSTEQLTSKTYFLYGQPTGAANMPTTGTASYQMTVAAHAFPGTTAAADRVTGTATLNANFGTGLVDTAIKLGSTFAGTGTISADQFSGTFSNTDPNMTVNGTFAGGFFGPNAKEAGMTFQIHVHVADPYAGATIRPQDTYITGAAAGPKT